MMGGVKCLFTDSFQILLSFGVVGVDDPVMRCLNQAGRATPGRARGLVRATRDGSLVCSSVVRRRPSVRNIMGFFKRLFGVVMRHDSQFKRLRASIRHTICTQSLRVTKSRKLVGSPFRSESRAQTPCQRLRSIICLLERSPDATPGSLAPLTSGVARTPVPCARTAFPSSGPAPRGSSAAPCQTAVAS